MYEKLLCLREEIKKKLLKSHTYVLRLYYAQISFFLRSFILRSRKATALKK